MLAGLFRNKKMQPWEIPALPGESAADHKERKRQTYFNDQRENNLEWFKRMDFQLDVTGMRVLDLGCGHGALAVSFAERGAAEVVGIDLDDDRIDFANRNLAANFPELAGRIQFRCEDVLSMSDQFDLIVSKDAFEHIDDLSGVIRHLHSMLCAGGLPRARLQSALLQSIRRPCTLRTQRALGPRGSAGAALGVWLNQRTGKGVNKKAWISDSTS